MSRETLDQWCERGILALVLAILVFGPLATGAVRTLEFLIIQGLTLGVMLLWLARFWLGEKSRLLWPPICWPVVAFALYAVARYLTSEIEYVARQEMIRVLIYAFLFLAILNNLYRQESAQIISLSLVFLAMGISFYAIYQFVTNSDHVYHFTKPYHHRGSGTYISPNHLGGFLEMLLPLGLAYTLTSRLKTLPKVFIGYAALVIVAGLAATVSRGSWIATALTLTLFFGVLIFHRTHRLPSFVFLAVMLGAGAFFIPRSDFSQDRLKQLFVDGKVDDDRRFDIWGPAVRVWQENVLWGGGPGHFDFRFRVYRPEDVQLHPRRVHNDFLNTLADWGLAGAALVASAMVLLAAGVLKTWRFVRGPSTDLGDQKSNKFAFILGASAGLTAILLHSVVDFNMHIPANAILAVTLMALLTAHLRFATDRYWVRIGPAVKILASVVLVAGLSYLGWQEWRRTSEYRWLERARFAPNFSPAKADLLQKAFATEPLNPETAYQIGEAYRVQSTDGKEDYKELGAKALDWFARSIKLNPLDSYTLISYGTCLDWINRQSESAPYFNRAEELDPNGYYTLANIGLHYVHLRDYAAAKPWFERSLRLQWEDNLIAQSYLQIICRRMLEDATNQFSAKLNLTEPK